MNEIPGGILSLVSVFFTGLALNLTPCVYPLISVSASLFSKHQHLSRFESFVRAFVYVLGMSTMLSSMGLAAALSGNLFGSLLQNPWVLFGIAVLLILLALSMFGVYVFQLPPFLLAFIGEKKSKAGLFGIYLSGLTVGVFAAPCLGPPVLGILTFVGTRGDPVFGFWIFFVMSFGLGLPYLVLGTYSNLLHRLPRSGVWLVWVEKLFGVILLVLAAFYLILAFRPDLLVWLPSVALALGGIHLGFIEHSDKYSPSFINFKRTFGMIAIIGAMLVPIFAPKEKVVWEAYAAEKVVQAKEQGKPVVLDFFADWCIPCHELDQFTYSDSRVIEALADFVRLKVDLTDPDDEPTKKAIKKFKIVGVPTIVFIDPRGDEIDKIRTTGFVDAKEFLELIDLPQLKKSVQ